MDNLRTGVREAIEAVGAQVRYLPACSPDLNPIEQAFSKLKTALRKGAARTFDALLKLVGKLVKRFAPQGHEFRPRRARGPSPQSAARLLPHRGITR
jgi:transposase